MCIRDRYQPPQQSESRVRSYSYKSRTIALILCVCLGYLGGHYFYVGKFGMGLLYFFTAGVFGIGWIVDIIRIAMGTFPDKQDRILAVSYTHLVYSQSTCQKSKASFV